MTRCTRRAALQLLAATAASAGLPGLTWLRTPGARAQAAQVPLRILFVEAGYGCRRGTFEPNVGGSLYVASDTVETNWAFRDSMAPLSPYRDRTTLFQGLDMLSARIDPSKPANAHIHGATHMLTADDRYMGSDAIGSGPSIDQLIAQELAKASVATRLQSLGLAATDGSGEYSRTKVFDSYSAPGQKVPFITHAPDAWDHIFAEPLSGDTQAQADAAARKAYVHNFVRGQYDRLLSQVSAEDRAKLSQMRDYHNDLNKAISTLNDRAANRPAQDSILGPLSGLDEGYARGSLSNRTWKTHCEVMSKLAAAALHTDTTRVVNLSFQEAPDYEIDYTPGAYGSTTQHDLTHQVSGDKPTLTDAAAAAVIDRGHTRIYERVRFLLDELASLQETDGQSLLDHTLVLVYSHIAEGSHDLTRLPWLVIGNAHGYLKTGQYIRFRPWDYRQNKAVAPDDGAFPYQWNGQGRAHNDLFITIANAMGVGITSFGNTSISTGPIAQMLA